MFSTSGVIAPVVDCLVIGVLLHDDCTNSALAISYKENTLYTTVVEITTHSCFYCMRWWSRLFQVHFCCMCIGSGWVGVGGGAQCSTITHGEVETVHTR